MSKANPFPDLMRAFFYEWLVEQRNASIHTVRSYRDTWRMFLRFVLLVGAVAGYCWFFQREWIDELLRMIEARGG